VRLLTHVSPPVPLLSAVLLSVSVVQTLRLYDARQNLSKRVIPSKMAQLDCCFKDTSATGFSGGLDKQVKQ
ncbi:unnamed protein product, partial [Ectocarpus sp. 8 AP-2014]